VGWVAEFGSLAMKKKLVTVGIAIGVLNVVGISILAWNVLTFADP
jgi:hypothetical protein